MEGIYLISGGESRERLEKGLEIAGDCRLSPLDLFLIQPLRTIGIEEIRQLKTKLSFKPFASPYKAAVIHEGEKLTLEAQNALLKILEEPPPHTIIILTAPSSDMLLPTLVSRCRLVRLSRKKKALPGEEITQSTENLIGIWKGNLSFKLKIADEAGKTKESALIWLEKMIPVLREIIMSRFFPQDSSFSSPLTLKPDGLTAKQLTALIRNFEKTRILIEKNVNPKLAMGNLFFSI